MGLSGPGKALLVGGAGSLNSAVADALRASGFAPVEVRNIGESLPEGGGDVAVVLGPSFGPAGPSLEQAESLFRALAESSFPHVVAVSSAAIFPPRHTHPGMVDEEKSPLRGVSVLSGAWNAFEAAARSSAKPGVTLTILRPASVPAADGRDHWSSVLSSSFASTFLGHDPSVQLLSAEDLGRAVVAAARQGKAGVFHVAPAGVVPVHRALSFAGTQRVPLPAWLHYVGRGILARLGVAPWAEVERLRYPSTISGAKIRAELGFEPLHSSAEVAASFKKGGRVERRTDLPSFDPYGLDKGYIAWLHRTVMLFLHDFWWRVEVAGLEHLPRQGPAVLVGVHRGFMPFDGTMILFDLVRHAGRYPRFLTHPTLLKEVFLSDFIAKQGGLVACRPNADFVLQSGELLGFFPEGVEGAFSYYKDAYRLREDFGRDEYVKAALRNGVPLIPFVTVGSAEMFPLLYKIDWGWWKKITEWPCFPIAPPWPLLPVPFPTKWHTLILPPLVPAHGRAAADDPAVVAEVSAEVKRRLQSAIDELRRRRKSLFFGEILVEEAKARRAASGA